VLINNRVKRAALGSKSLICSDEIFINLKESVNWGRVDWGEDERKRVAMGVGNERESSSWFWGRIPAEDLRVSVAGSGMGGRVGGMGIEG
jgi:hypothetical protein